MSAGMESKEDFYLEHSGLEQKDEINTFSNWNKASTPLSGQTRNDVASGICSESQTIGPCMQSRKKLSALNHSF